MRKSILTVAIGLIALMVFIQAAASQNEPDETAGVEAPTVILSVNPATNCLEGIFTDDQAAAERTVSSEQILSALAANQCVRLVGAIVDGDIDLTTLPANSLDSFGDSQVSVAGAIVFKNSHLSGKFNAAKRPNSPRLYFQSPVIFDGSTLGAFEAGGSTFASSVRFAGAILSSIRMDSAHFMSDAVFSEANFRKPVYLTNIKVEGTLDLENAQFGSVSRFFGLTAKGPVDLTGARFSTTADLSGWHVNAVYASGTKFDRAVQIANGTWNGPTDMSKSVFNGSTDFTANVYHGYTDFNGVQLNSSARFFGTQFNGLADFANSSFMASVTFITARFGSEASFVNALFDADVVFDQSVFTKPIDFSNSIFNSRAGFKSVRFDDWSTFAGAQFQDLNMSEALFLSPAGSDWRLTKVNGAFDRSRIMKAAPWLMEGVVDPDFAKDPIDEELLVGHEEDSEYHENEEIKEKETHDDSINGSDHMPDAPEVIVVESRPAGGSYVLASIWSIIILVLIIRLLRAA